MTNQKDQHTASSQSNERLEQEITLLSDRITDHIAHCSECHPSDRPVALGQESGLCEGYWDMVEAWARDEGYVNNIVARDEYGNEAPKNSPQIPRSELPERPDYM